MNGINIKSYTYTYNAVDSATQKSIYRLRYRTFHKRLGWQVKFDKGLEYDNFDNNDTVYTVLKVHNQVYACTRLICTTRSYMFRDVFPELARGEEIPQDPTVWEISRFAVDRSLERDYKGVISDATYELFRALYTFAQEKHIKEYVMVTTTAAERIMKLMGLPVNRFGDKKSTLIGRANSVALRLPVNRVYAGSIFH